ncbi:hypothetical protein LZY01_15820 [Levilactobacillus zymae]|uniref:Mobile element protein n=1 Tax=Levilactobacillus zymae TaxID=267363 RepID=A0ABQ0WX80_9LACO|nr:hypothetical protein LZY01_15820 [Levilactobacillus zymae]
MGLKPCPPKTRFRPFLTGLEALNQPTQKRGTASVSRFRAWSPLKIDQVVVDGVMHEVHVTVER